LNFVPANEPGRFLYHLYTKLLFVTICCKSVTVVSFVIIDGVANILHNVPLLLFVDNQLYVHVIIAFANVSQAFASPPKIALQSVSPKLTSSHSNIPHNWYSVLLDVTEYV
jgi:hypothetical protein